MIFEDFLPSPPLQAYVINYNVRHFTFVAASAIPFKPYAPRPEHALAFFPRDPERVEYVTEHRILRRPASAIIGQHTLRTNRLLGTDMLVFIVNFRPGVLYRLLGISLQEFTNTCIDAEVFFSKDIRLVNQRLNSSDSYQEMKYIIEGFLLGQLGKMPKPAHALDKVSSLLMQHPQRHSLDWLANQSCLSPRQFQRLFIERMGIGPKLFARIARFDQAFRHKNNFPHKDWLTIALACGYNDYQHLVKDYKEFALVTPTIYYGQDCKAPERYFGRYER